jgi:leader peptidase (prepilin peptidase)/N-methyltransferase
MLSRVFAGSFILIVDALPIGFAILAPFVGSFLGLLAVRLPERRPVLIARSQCDHCGAVLGPFELIPLASWLWLRGRCRHCRAPITGVALFMELAALAVVAWAALAVSGWVFAVTCILGWLLLVLAVIDWRAFLLPDVLTAPLAILGLVATYLLNPDAILDHVIGAAAGFAVLAIIAAAYKRWRGRDGLGLGDAKLLGALGAWVSWQGLPSVVLYAAVIGLIAVLVQSRLGRGLTAATRIPFGTFLALGGWLVWLYGPLMPA